MAFRDSPFQALRASLTWMAAVVVVVAVAVALFLTDRRTGAPAGSYGAARSEFDEVMEPVTNLFAAPVRWVSGLGDVSGGYFFAVSQNRALKQQVADLARWRAEAVALKNLNLRYESLLKLRTDPPIPMVTARVVSDAHGPYADARLANAGAAQGVKIGNPVMSEDGVVGRIVGVSRNASRILLLTDVESRTPVLIDRSNARAILTGDGGPNPKLEFVRGMNAVKDGDTVLTSGDGGLYPRGLPVGVAAEDYRGVWRVRLYSDRAAIDFVRILVFDDFSQMVSQAQLAQSAMPALTPEEQSQLQAARAAAAKPASTPAAAGSPPGSAAQTPPALSPSTPAAPLPKAASNTAGVAPPKALKKPRLKDKPKIPRGSFNPDAGSATDRPEGPQ